MNKSLMTLKRIRMVVSMFAPTALRLTSQIFRWRLFLGQSRLRILSLDQKFQFLKSVHINNTSVDRKFPALFHRPTHLGANMCAIGGTRRNCHATRLPKIVAPFKSTRMPHCPPIFRRHDAFWFDSERPLQETTQTNTYSSCLYLTGESFGSFVLSCWFCNRHHALFLDLSRAFCFCPHYYLSSVSLIQCAKSKVWQQTEGVPSIRAFLLFLFAVGLCVKRAKGHEAIQELWNFQGRRRQDEASA